MKPILIIFALTLSSGALFMRAAHADPGRAFADMERTEPGLDEIRRAALRYAGLASQPEKAWGLRARLAGLLPEVSLKAQRGRAQDEEFSESSTGTEKHERDLDLEARAEWALDRLVFDEAELRAAQTAQRLHRDRIQLLTQVTNLYFQRRKLQLAVLFAPDSDPGKAALQALAIAEATAQLDALTGGYFSRALARRRAARQAAGGRGG